MEIKKKEGMFDVDVDIYERRETKNIKDAINIALNLKKAGYYALIVFQEDKYVIWGSANPRWFYKNKEV